MLHRNDLAVSALTEFWVLPTLKESFCANGEYDPDGLNSTGSSVCR